MCDTVVVVREGEVLFGKNSDRDPNEAQLLDWQPTRSYPAGTALRCTWITIPQVRQTHAVLLSRPYWMWGAEMGANEHGVVIGNEAVFTRAATQATGLLGMDLVRLSLERASSAERAVDVLRGLLAAHGQGGRAGYDDPAFTYHNSFLIADAGGAFVVETADREVAVERVRSGVRAISNGLTLPALRPRRDRLRGAVAQCRTRRARMEALARAAEGPEGIAVALADHGAGGLRYGLWTGAMSAPCMHAGGLLANSQTVGSWISRLRPDGVQHWATATAAPCLSAFKPVDIGTPLDLGQPTGVRDEHSIWWRFEALHRALIGDAEAKARWRTERDALQRALWPMDSAAAFARWDACVASWSEEPGVDGRPAWTRRYWQRRDEESAQAVPKLPPWSG
jgi:secernin